MLHTITSILGQDTTITVIVGLIGMAWTAFKASDWYKAHCNGVYLQAVQCLEVGIETAYQTYVREIKAARDDGKLTDDERVTARRRAVESAIEYGRARGIDVVAVLGREYIDVLISRIVERAKGKTAEAEQNAATIAKLAACPDIQRFIDGLK